MLAISIVIGTLMAAWVLPSCSAKYHLNKYQNKGGVCGKIDTIRTVRYDTLTNTFYKFDSLVIVNDRIVPQTRLETRIQYKIHKDTVRERIETVKYHYKERKLQNKENTQWSKSLNWAIILAIVIVVFLVLKQIKIIR